MNEGSLFEGVRKRRNQSVSITPATVAGTGAQSPLPGIPTP